MASDGVAIGGVAILAVAIVDVATVSVTTVAVATGDVAMSPRVFAMGAATYYYHSLPHLIAPKLLLEEMTIFRF